MEDKDFHQKQIHLVKENGLAIQFIKNTSLEVQIEAITGNKAKDIIKYINFYIPNQHPELYKEYIKLVRDKMNASN